MGKGHYVPLEGACRTLRGSMQTNVAGLGRSSLASDLAMFASFRAGRSVAQPSKTLVSLTEKWE